MLQPLPAPLVVGLVVRDDSPRNLDLAAQFNAGLQQAGIVVTGTPTAQLTLHATFSGNGPDDAAREANPDTSASWWNGGVTQQYAPSSQFGGGRKCSGRGNPAIARGASPVAGRPGRLGGDVAVHLAGQR